MNKLNNDFNKEKIRKWFSIDRNITLVKIIIAIIIVIISIVLLAIFPDSYETIAGTSGGVLFMWLLYEWLMGKQK